MFCLLYRETRQLEKLRSGAEQFGESPESAEKLPEEGDGVAFFRNAVDYIADNF